MLSSVVCILKDKIMKINYEFTLKDCNNYVRETLFMKRFFVYFIKDNLLRAIIVSLVLSLWFCYYLLNLNIVSIVVCFFAWLIIAYIVWGLMDYCTGGKNLYKMMNGLDMKYELTLENDVIKRKSSYGEISFSWNKLKGINNTKKNILLFISERQAIIVPKRIFETKQELDDFWTIVQENYKNHTT